VVAVLVAAAFATGARPAAAEGEPSTIVLHVDDQAHLAPSELATAEAETTRIYAAAGVRATWQNGTVDPHAGHEGVTHLAVVICDDAGSEQKTGAEGVDSTVLGQTARGTGRAYIYHTRVDIAAHQHGRDIGTVLGMAIAHEVGHLLLPNDSHSFVGIMRADLNLTSRFPQEFTPRQSAAIRARLSGDARTAR
jgi:hypothetical protein